MGESRDTIERIDDALQQLGREFGAEECHGLLTGFYCASGGLEEAQWLALIAPEVDRHDLLVEESLTLMTTMLAETARQLNDTALGFHLLLDDESEAIGDRVESLGLWCQGFLLGLSEGGIADPAKLPSDSGEVLRDLIEIAGIDSYALSGEGDEGDEEDEIAITELVEFVRTAVLLLNEELNPSKAPPRQEVTVH